jgi:hypothetical protein
MALCILRQATYVPSVPINNISILGQTICSGMSDSTMWTGIETIPCFAMFSTSAWKEEVEEDDVECAYDHAGNHLSVFSKTLRPLSCLSCYTHIRIQMDTFHTS